MSEMQWEEALARLAQLFPKDDKLREEVQGHLAVHPYFRCFFVENELQTRAALLTLPL